MFTAETCWEQLKAESSITYHPSQDSGSIMEEGTNRTWSWRKRWNVENASIRAWRDYCILELSGAVIISKRPAYDWPTDILPQTGVGHEAPFLPENINASSAVAIGKERLKEEGQHSSRLILWSGVSITYPVPLLKAHASRMEFLMMEYYRSFRKLSGREERSAGKVTDVQTQKQGTATCLWTCAGQQEVGEGNPLWLSSQPV